jgi:peptidoglycan/xylan/chitin deacetylase (PgdA/CDA1 family)
MTLFRNPAGIFSEQSLAVTKSCGYKSIFWSFAYYDYDPADQPEPTAALNKMMDKLHPGAIYLLHAVSATNTEVLGDFIDQVRAAGYEFAVIE